MINKRIWYVFREEQFQTARPLSENALKDSGYKSEMKYEGNEMLNSKNR